MTMTSIIYKIHRASINVYDEKQNAKNKQEQKIKHDCLKRNIREVVHGTSDEMMYDQYVRILTNMYHAQTVIDYDEVIDDISFIINQPLPLKFILTELETYMVMLDVFHCVKVKKLFVNYGINP